MRYTIAKSDIFWIIIFITVVVGLALVWVHAINVNVDNKTLRQGTGAVVSNCADCAEIGGRILANGGSAADAVIVTLLCEGIILPHSLGLGGGFVATIYDSETNKIETLIARETAPAAAHRDMFIDRKITGAIAAAVPGEISGYWDLHGKYGRLPWRILFDEPIKLCTEGHTVTDQLATILALNTKRIQNEPSLSEIFINPKTEEIYQKGEIMYRPQLAKTLKVIAEGGAAVMYEGGHIGRMLAEDIQEMGGIITLQDLTNYKVRWEEPILAHIDGGYSLYTTPLPTGGAVLAFILNVMNLLYTEDRNVYWQRLTETFKHAYGHRTNLGDPHFEPQVKEMLQRMISLTYPWDICSLIKDDETSKNFEYYGANFTNEEDRGTANIVVLAPNGDAISVTSTINNHLGSKVRSRRTGIILNDEMDDFSTPGLTNTYGIPSSPSNYIKPGKRPMSSACPSIVFDRNNRVCLVIGGAGGSKITTSVAQTILRYLVLNESMENAMSAARLHHQLSPMHVDVEREVNESIISYLKGIGHDINYLSTDKAFSALTAIGMKCKENPELVCDRRRHGSAAIVYVNNQN